MFQIRQISPYAFLTAICRELKEEYKRLSKIFISESQVKESPKISRIIPSRPININVKNIVSLSLSLSLSQTHNTHLAFYSRHEEEQSLYRDWYLQLVHFRIISIWTERPHCLPNGQASHKNNRPGKKTGQKVYNSTHPTCARDREVQSETDVYYSTENSDRTEAERLRGYWTMETPQPGYSRRSNELFLGGKRARITIAPKPRYG